MKRTAKENQVMRFNAKVWLERIGFNPNGVRVRLKERDGWSMPIEFVSVESARKGLVEHGAKHPWKAAACHDAVATLRGFR